MPPFRGFFINLEQSVERRESITRNLAEAGVADLYQRFPAVDGRAAASDHPCRLKPGALGIWLSHEKLVAENLSSPDHLHILEDDAIVPLDAGRCLADMLARADQRLKSWDIIFTEAFLTPEVSLYELLKYNKRPERDDAMMLLPLYRVDFACLSSMFINRNSLAKYLDLIRGQWSLGRPLDIHLRNLAAEAKLDAFLTLPFLTTISPQANESTIEGSLDLSKRVMTAFRRTAYKDADAGKLHEELLRLVGNPKLSIEAESFIAAAKFYLSEDFVNF